MRNRNVLAALWSLPLIMCVLCSSAARGQPSIFDEGFLSKTQSPPQAPATRPTSANRNPIPTTAALNVVQPLLEEVYAKELADVTPQGKLRLSAKLLMVANSARDEPVHRYAMMSRALALAGSGGDPQLMIKVSGQLAEEYEVDPFQAIADTLAAAVAADSLPDWEVQNIVSAAMVAAEAAVAQGEASSCEALLKVAQRGAQTHPAATEIAAQLRANEGQIRQRLGELAKIEAARASLKRNPADAASATVLGAHLCFERNDWAAGLPLLAKCDNQPLRTIATQELSQPTTATSQLSLADAWWGYATKLDGVRKGAVLKRSGLWYARAEPSLTGLRREVARKRMQEAGVSVEEALASPVTLSNVRKVVYVCDATGTMLGLKFKLVQKQVYRAIGALSSDQSFNLIFFRGGSNDLEWAQPFSNKLEQATPDKKQELRTFVDTFQVVGKGTNPLPALRRAIQLKPDAVHFLTDGEFNNVVSYEQVLTEVRKLNLRGGVRVNTIAFLSDDPRAEQVLKALAAENGGTFKKVTDRDLE